MKHQAFHGVLVIRLKWNDRDVSTENRTEQKIEEQNEEVTSSLTTERGKIKPMTDGQTDVCLLVNCKSWSSTRHPKVYPDEFGYVTRI